jgi:hypothetical protein
MNDYITNIKQQTEVSRKTFVDTLNLMPNGVLLIDVKTKEILFSNRHMELLLPTGKNLCFEERVQTYKLHADSKQVEKEAKN